MGLVPHTGQAKTFEGNPTNQTNLSDANSIQGAIKGTLSNPALANTKIMSTLAGLARLDMFVPKRTTVPIDAVSFRGFPRPTVTMTIQFFEYDSSSGALDLRVEFNNRVGYPIDITIRARMTTTINSNTQREVTRTFQPGNTSLLYIFEWNTSTFGSSEEYYITMLTSSYPVYGPANLEGVKSRKADPVPPGLRAEVYFSAQGFSCYLPSNFGQTGPGANHYIDGGLTVGSTVRNDLFQLVANDTYIDRFGNYIYTTVNGQITQLEYCVVD